MSCSIGYRTSSRMRARGARELLLVRLSLCPRWLNKIFTTEATGGPQGKPATTARIESGSPPVIRIKGSQERKTGDDDSPSQLFARALDGYEEEYDERGEW